MGYWEELPMIEITYRDGKSVVQFECAETLPTGNYLIISQKTRKTVFRLEDISEYKTASQNVL